MPTSVQAGRFQQTASFPFGRRSHGSAAAFAVYIITAPRARPKSDPAQSEVAGHSVAIAVTHFHIAEEVEPGPSQGFPRPAHHHGHHGPQLQHRRTNGQGSCDCHAIGSSRRSLWSQCTVLHAGKRDAIHFILDSFSYLETLFRNWCSLVVT